MCQPAPAAAWPWTRITCCSPSWSSWTASEHPEINVITTHTRTCAFTHTHTHTHAHAHTHTHTHTHAHVHSHTNTHTRVHTNIQANTLRDHLNTKLFVKGAHTSQQIQQKEINSH